MGARASPSSQPQCVCWRTLYFSDALLHCVGAPANHGCAVPTLCCHPLQFVTLWSRRRGLGPYVQFIDSSENLEPDWHPEQIEIMDRQTNFKVRQAGCYTADQGLRGFIQRMQCQAAPIASTQPSNCCRQCRVPSSLS